MVHSLPQERWREKRPETTESLFSISCWSRKNALRSENVGNSSFNYLPCLPSANCNFLSTKGVWLLSPLSSPSLYLSSSFSSSSSSWDGGWLGRVIPWPASDPSLDSVELCHENQHCAPFADTLHHHHFQLFQDFQFKDNIDVYSRWSRSRWF